MPAPATPASPLLRPHSALDPLEANRLTVGRVMEDCLIDRSFSSIESGFSSATDELCYVVAVDATQQQVFSTSESMREISELAIQSGFLVQGAESQRLDRENPDYYICAGKLREIFAELSTRGCACIVFDGELSPSQQRNIEDLHSAHKRAGERALKVVDRTALVVGLLARQASSHEQSLQAECAQLMYFLPRMSAHLASLACSDRTACLLGPCDKPIETDVRVMRKRISVLKKELEAIAVQRVLQRENRRKSGMPVVAVVGYAGAGKSAVFEALTDCAPDADQTSARLFSTLSAVSRKVAPKRVAPAESGEYCSEFILTDTMGLLGALPDVVLRAFRSSLADEVEAADVLLHVVDVSHPHWRKREVATLRELSHMGGGDKVLLTVFNQRDSSSAEGALPMRRASLSVRHVDAPDRRFGELEKQRCLDLIKDSFASFMVDLETSLPYFRASTWSCLNSVFCVGTLVDVKYEDACIKVKGKVPKQLLREIELMQKGSDVESDLEREVSVKRSLVLGRGQWAMRSGSCA